MSPVRPVPDRFLVAFSFAGEQRELIRSIAEAVEQRLGRGTVFFDEWWKHEIAAINHSDLKLQQIYKERSELVVVGISQDYADKVWKGMEWDAIRSRLITRSAGNVDRIWPLRVGEGVLPGMHENSIYDDARESTPKQAAERIVARLRKLVPDAGKPSVFLAECLLELEDYTKPVCRQRLQAYLEEFGWLVRPQASLLESEDYASALEDELKKCQAFVQLLGPSPWKWGRFDKRQYEAACHRKLPVFRFRGDFDLAKLKETNEDHFRFVTTEADAGGFLDFVDILQKKLADLLLQRERIIREAQQQERADASDDASVRPHRESNSELTAHPENIVKARVAAASVPSRTLPGPKSAQKDVITTNEMPSGMSWKANRSNVVSCRTIFISYARENREDARRVAEILQRQGWGVWWDADNLLAGEDFDSAIEAALEKACCVVVLWSSVSVKSRWVKGEAEIGLERQRLVPVKIDQCKPPIQFRSLHHRDLTLTNANDRNAEIERLVNDVRRFVDAAAPNDRE